MYKEWEQVRMFLVCFGLHSRPRRWYELYVSWPICTRGLVLGGNALKRPDFFSDRSRSDYQASLCEVTSDTRLRKMSSQGKILLPKSGASPKYTGSSLFANLTSPNTGGAF